MEAKTAIRLIERELAHAGESYSDQDVPVHFRVRLLVKEYYRLVEKSAILLDRIDSLKKALEDELLGPQEDHEKEEE